jgi:dethiobiotin synthetase
VTKKLKTLNLETEIFLIVGTDTGVGKTVFSGLLAR